jgi:putative transposase
MIGLHEEGIVQHYGLSFKYISYNCDALGALRRHFGNRLHLEFVVDPDDLGSINVMHPREGFYISVPATHPEYARGLKLYQHKALIKAAEIENRQIVDEIELAHIRNSICKSLSPEVAKKNKRINRNKVLVLQRDLESRSSAPKALRAPRNIHQMLEEAPVQTFEVDSL